MKYTIDSPEFLAAYTTLDSNLYVTDKTCKAFSKDSCDNCVYYNPNTNSDICDPFIHLRDIFNKKEFEEKYSELFI